MRALARLQAQVMAQSRFGIPAIAHEECLTGLAAWKATVFPAPLAWGASFDAETVTLDGRGDRRQHARGRHPPGPGPGPRRGARPAVGPGRGDHLRRPVPGRRAGHGLRAGPGVVRGDRHAEALRRVLGVARGQEHGAGQHRLARARRRVPEPVRDGAAARAAPARSCTPTPTTTACPWPRTRRCSPGSCGTSSASTACSCPTTTGCRCWRRCTGWPGRRARRPGWRSGRGVDVELPNTRCFGAPLAQAVTSGQVPVGLVDQAAGRVLRQKFELGLLDAARDVMVPTARPVRLARMPGGRRGRPAGRLISTRPRSGSWPGGWPSTRSFCWPTGPGRCRWRMAAGSRWWGRWPTTRWPGSGRYTFPRHVLVSHPGTGPGLALTPFLDALRQELPAARVEHARGCGVQRRGPVRVRRGSGAARGPRMLLLRCSATWPGCSAAAAAGRAATRAACGCPASRRTCSPSWSATGTPVVAVLITGRPYALGPVADQLAAVVQAFFPGAGGAGRAIAGVLSGRVVPSGKLPLEMPRHYDAPPSGYLAPPLAQPARRQLGGPDAAVPVRARPVVHHVRLLGFVGLPGRCGAGQWRGPGAGRCGGRPRPGGGSGGGARARIGTDGAAEIACTVRNTGAVAGAEVVQLYLHDPVAQVTRPVRALAGFARVTLPPGGACRVAFRLHADRTAFHGLAGTRIVEPGPDRAGYRVVRGRSAAAR